MSLQIILIGVAVVLLCVLVWWLFFRKKDDADYSEDERALLKAKFFDRYEIKGVRKRAPMSTMYRAIDTETKSIVALRILHPEYSGDPDQVKSFLSRGEVLEFLNKQHANLAVIRLLKYGTALVGRQNRPFIATEFFPGVDLGELLREKKALTVNESTSIIRQISQSLAVALRERIWHHQLAMEAVMVQYERGNAPTVKIVDFDLAKQDQMVSGALAAQGISRLTFMSPEQFENKIVDARSDVYSLGVLYYILLCGRPPFDEADYGGMARMHTGSIPPPLPDSVAAPVRVLVSKMLAKQVVDRYRTMDDVVSAVDALVPDASWDIPPDTSGIKPLMVAQQSRRRSGPVPTQSRSSRGSDREPSRSSGSSESRNVLSMIMMEIPMFYKSFVGKVIMRLMGAISIKKLALVLLLLVVGGLVYFLVIRSDDVKGSIAVNVRDKQGKAIANAEVSINRLTTDETKSAAFVDPVSDQKSKGKASGTTDNKGEFRVRYEVSPNTELLVNVAAGQYLPNPAVDTVRITCDSTITLTVGLAPQPPQGPKLLTVTVRDRGRNPVPSVTALITGKSGTEQPVQTDAKGKGTLSYDVVAEGMNPKVALSAEQLGPAFAHSNAKQGTVVGSKLDIDINDFFPYDETIETQMKQARFLVNEEEWKRAIPVLQQAITIRPGLGSAEAYALLAKSMFEKDDDDYKDVLKLLDKALADRSSISGPGQESALETMYYYRVVAIYETYNRLKSSDPTRPNAKRMVLKLCTEYKDLYKSPKFKSLLQRDKRFKNNLGRVEDYQDKVE